MSEMIERVARALRPDAMRLPPSESLHQEALGLARVAIEAMREPTEAMVSAGLFAPHLPRDREMDPVIENDWAVTQYAAMIDAALGEKS